MRFLRTFVGVSVLLCAVTLALADPQPTYPSIDKQIKTSLEPFNMLYTVGIVHDIFEKTINKTLREDHAKHVTGNDSKVFNESYHLKYYLKKDKIDLPQRILESVLNDSLFLGTNESQIEMKIEIKRDFNNGTLTDHEVDNVLNIILRKLRTKTINELKKYTKNIVNKKIMNTFKESFEPFNMLYKVGIVREILEKTINKTLTEDHAKLATNDSIVFNKRHYVKNLKKDIHLQRRILNVALNNSLFLGTNESHVEMKNEISINFHKDHGNATLADDEIDSVLNLMKKKLRSKTKLELKKFINEHLHKDVNNTMKKGKQQKIKKNNIKS